MKMIHALLSISIILSLFSCRKEAVQPVPKLLFSSGFEMDVVLSAPFEGYQPLQGKDAETGFSWPINILGARESAMHFVDHDNFQALETEIQT
ncbi:MAG TPA: hypothetical protein ENJ82_09520, partial [Bacteroidetes bacterium]|nr:hypothetical protein [Bacteroidota bacterium]